MEYSVDLLDAIELFSGQSVAEMQGVGLVKVGMVVNRWWWYTCRLAVGLVESRCGQVRSFNRYLRAQQTWKPDTQRHSLLNSGYFRGKFDCGVLR